MRQSEVSPPIEDPFSRVLRAKQKRLDNRKVTEMVDSSSSQQATDPLSFLVPFADAAVLLAAAAVKFHQVLDRMSRRDPTASLSLSTVHRL